MNRELLKKKLHDKMKQKRLSRTTPNTKQIKKMKEDINDLLKDKRLTCTMLELYKNALLKYPNNNISKPNEILDNPDKYKKEYGKYVFEIIKKAKEKNLNISAIKSLFDNEYTEYITNVLNIPN
jgi:protoporphyrinogen oxidase